MATTTIQEEDVYSLSSPTGGEGWGEEADFIEYPSPLTLSPLVPRGAKEKISGGCIKMRPEPFASDKPNCALSAIREDERR